MSYTKEQRIVNATKIKQHVEERTPIAHDMFIPNHSGDHSAGRVNSTPVNDYDIVNKSYVDAHITGTGTAVHGDSYLLNTGDNATGDYNFDSNTFVIDSTNNRIGIGGASPSAILDICPPATITVPGLILNTTDSNNAYTLKVLGHTGGDSHVQLATDVANSKLTLIAGTVDDNAPRFHLVGRSDTSFPGYSTFDFGSKLTDLPNAQMTMRHLHPVGDPLSADLLTIIGRTEVVINQIGIDCDFRVETDSNANVFFCEGSTDRVGINTNSPAVGFDCVTASRFGDSSTNYTAINSTGDLTFTGSAGFYPRRIRQASIPANGTGSTQIDVGEIIIWEDSDDDSVHLVYNDTTAGIKSVALT